MKKVQSKTKVKIHEADQIILHEHQAVNFKSDAEYGILQSDPKKSKKRRIVNRQQQVNLANVFNESFRQQSNVM